MQLETLARFFSNEISQWPVVCPSKALPFYMKSLIQNTWGKKYSVNDYHKKQAPNRFGVTTRGFQIGDPLKSISMNHLLRLNQFVTKLDVSSGQKNVLILFHTYENMSYSSELSEVNKGQLANAVCAILETIHKNLGQQVKIKSLTNSYFFESCLKWQKLFQFYEKIYFISDFLFQTESIFSSAEEVEKVVKYFHLKDCVFILTRDPLEISTQNHHQKTDELFPWSDSSLRNRNYFSDEIYSENLRKQISDFKSRMKKCHNDSVVLTPQNTIFEFLTFLNENFLNSRS